MGFKKSKASSAIAIAAALLLSGCSEDENSSSTYSSTVSQSSSSASSTSGSSVSEETSDVSAITPDPHYLDNYSDVVDDALNAVDTSKPIVNEEQTNSDATGENDQNGENGQNDQNDQTSSAPSSSSTSQNSQTSSSSTSSSSSEPTTSAPSSSSSNQSGQTSSSSTPSSSTITPPPSIGNIEQPAPGTAGNRLGEEAWEERNQAAIEAHEKIDNGTLDTTAGMTQEDFDYLDSLFGIS